MTTTPTPATPSVSVEREEYVLVPKATLEPFSKLAGELFAMNLNASDEVLPGWCGAEEFSLNAGQFFALRRAIAAPAPNSSPAAKSGEAEEAELEDRIDNAVQAMSETHHSWEARCHAVMAALGFNFGWADPKIDAETPSALATPSPQPADAVREAFKQTLASLVAAVSLLKRGSKKAASSDGMFDAMIRDYENAIEQARAALTEPAPAGEAVEPVTPLAWTFEWAPFGHEQWQPDVSLSDPLVHGGVRRYRNVRPLFAHPAPEDTARLREDLEQAKRDRDMFSDWFKAEREEKIAAERERDDARSALETAAEDERDRLYAEVVNPHTGLVVKDGRSGGWAGATRFWLEDKGAMLPSDRIAARSASREATR